MSFVPGKLFLILASGLFRCRDHHAMARRQLATYYYLVSRNTGYRTWKSFLFVYIIIFKTNKVRLAGLQSELRASSLVLFASFSAKSGSGSLVGMMKCTGMLTELCPEPFFGKGKEVVQVL